MAKRKEKVSLDSLNFKPLLEETVACSRLGRTIASYGATLTNREKHDRELVYALLKAGREMPQSYATASISTETKDKKTTPTEAIKWFAKNYPKESEPLLAKLEEKREQSNPVLLYGIKSGRDLSDDYYVKILIDVLEIPQQDAAVFYHGVIKPHLQRMSEEEGLVKVAMK